jgi:uncharacterized protein YdeI (BOF family)
MNKKFLPLILAAGLISALLLFAGTALMDRLSPVYAARLPALFTGGADTLVAQNDSITIQLPARSDDSFNSTPEATASVTADASKTPAAGGTSAPQSTPMPGNPQGTQATIAQLVANPEQYRGTLVSLSGIATSLDGDKFLLNDGTGQIIIDLEDDLVRVTVVNGSQVTVLGQFKVRNDGVEVDACVFDGGSGSVQVDACENETQTGEDKGGLNSGSDDSSGSNSGSSSGSDDSSGSNSGSGSDSGSGSNSGSGSSGSGSGSGDSSGSNSGSGSSGSGKGGHDDPTPHP